MAKKRRTTSPTRRPARGSTNMKTTMSAVGGGAAGALIGGLLVRSGVAVNTAAIGVTAAGAVGAMTLKGASRTAAYGAAAAGAGQLALGWLAGRSAKQQSGQASAKPKRQGLDPRDADHAFDDAYREAERDYHDAEFQQAA